MPDLRTYRYFGHMVTALVRQDCRILLVQEQHPDAPVPSWALPSGKVEPTEGLVAALQRELKEETGLTLEGMPLLAFTVQVFTEAGEEVVEGIGFHFICEVSGQLQPRDPDRLVIAAQWFSVSEALDLLASLGWYDCTFLRQWLNGDVGVGAVYTIRKSGSPGGSA